MAIPSNLILLLIIAFCCCSIQRVLSEDPNPPMLGPPAASTTASSSTTGDSTASELSTSSTAESSTTGSTTSSSLLSSQPSTQPLSSTTKASTSSIVSSSEDNVKNIKGANNTVITEAIKAATSAVTTAAITAAITAATTVSTTSTTTSTATRPTTTFATTITSKVTSETTTSTTTAATTTEDFKRTSPFIRPDITEPIIYTTRFKRPSRKPKETPPPKPGHGPFSLFELSPTMVGNEMMGHLNNAMNSRLNPMNLLRRSSSTPEPTFDYLLLSIQWPIHLCGKDQCIRNPIQNWGIHGLWPNSKNNKHPFNCNPNSQLDPKVISDIHDELEDKWFSVLKRSTNQNFWNHEWTKHGTCAIGSRAGASQKQYFQTALKLFDENPVGKWLAEANIHPSPDPNRTLSFHSIAEVIARKKLNSFRISCRAIRLPNGYGGTRKEPVLESINLCFNKDLKSVECPGPRTNCPLRVLYPTYKLTMGQ